MSIHINHNQPDKTPLPGTFRATLCDPPWSLQQKGDLGAGNHYDLMTDERILGMGEAMREIMAENSFCFLWVTTATVPLGIKVLEAWGYRYTSFYFWAKPRLMLGNQDLLRPRRHRRLHDQQAHAGTGRAGLPAAAEIPCLRQRHAARAEHRMDLHRYRAVTCHNQRPGSGVRSRARTLRRARDRHRTANP